MRLPKLCCAEGKTDAQALVELVSRAKQLSDGNTEYIDRLKEELGVIKGKFREILPNHEGYIGQSE